MQARAAGQEEETKHTNNTGHTATRKNNSKNDNARAHNGPRRRNKT
jgi:hypothetical protein